LEDIGSSQYRFAKLLAGLVVLKLNNEKWLYELNNRLIKHIVLFIILNVLFVQTAIAEDTQPIQIIEVTIEDRIKEVFPEQSTLMIHIAKCESGLKQYNSNGKVLISKTSDKGVFQINQVHWENAKKLGFDIDTLEGNLSYARYLYDRNGTKDWYMSKHCWQNYEKYIDSCKVELI